MKKVLAVIAILLLIAAGVIFFLSFSHKKPAPALTKGTATIDKQTFSIEVATTASDQEQGLSDRTSLAKDHGMLFLFKSPCYCAFWMHHMKIPLDIIFIKDNKIVTIYKNLPVPAYENNNPPAYAPTEAINKVLEITAGLSDTYKFKVGDTITTSL